MPDRIGNPCVVVVVIAVAVVVVVNLLEDLLRYNSTDVSLIPGLDIGVRKIILAAPSMRRSKCVWEVDERKNLL